MQLCAQAQKDVGQGAEQYALTRSNLASSLASSDAWL